MFVSEKYQFLHPRSFRRLLLFVNTSQINLQPKQKVCFFTFINIMLCKNPSEMFKTDGNIKEEVADNQANSWLILLFKLK